MTRKTPSHIRFALALTLGLGLFSCATAATPMSVDNVRNLQEILSWETQGIPVLAVEASQDGSRIFGTRGHIVTIWDAATGGILDSWPADPGYAAGMGLSPDESLLATAGSDGSVKVWETKTGALVRTFSPAGTHTVAFSPDGARIASGGTSGVLRVWDVDTGAMLHEIDTGSRMFDVDFSPDGASIATVHGLPDFAVRLWNAAGGDLLWDSFEHDGDAHSASFSPNGDYLATVDGDGRVYVFDAVTGERLRSLVGHRAPLFCVRFITDRLLATGDGGGQVKLWDVEAGRWLADVSIFRSQISALGVSPDREVLVLASFDMRVVLLAVPEG